MKKNEMPQVGDQGTQGRKIEVSITRDELAQLKPESKLNFTVIDATGNKVSKTMSITQIEQIGEMFSIEGTTKAQADGTGGSLVTLEINPNDPQANRVLF